jgi:hypothetical protein
MAQPTDTREINPDGADLDGTAEIERQQAEGNKRSPGAGPQNPADDARASPSRPADQSKRN